MYCILIANPFYVLHFNYKSYSQFVLESKPKEDKISEKETKTYIIKNVLPIHKRAFSLYFEKKTIKNSRSNTTFIRVPGRAYGDGFPLSTKTKAFKHS